MKRLVIVAVLVAAASRATDINEFALAYNAWANMRNLFLTVGKEREKEIRQWERTKKAWEEFRKTVDREYGKE